MTCMHLYMRYCYNNASTRVLSHRHLDHDMMFIYTHDHDNDANMSSNRHIGSCCTDCTRRELLGRPRQGVKAQFGFVRKEKLHKKSTFFDMSQNHPESCQEASGCHKTLSGAVLGIKTCSEVVQIQLQKVIMFDKIYDMLYESPWR